jgi:hypothetical protein
LCFVSTTGAERRGVQTSNHFDPDGSGHRPGIFQSGTASRDIQTGFCFNADAKPGFAFNTDAKPGSDFDADAKPGSDFDADAKPGSCHANAGC